MSIGLRLLLDMNNSHVAELQKAGYKPALSTIILASVGIGLMYVPPSHLLSFLAQLTRRPIISYAQYRFWKEPFSRTEASLREYQLAVRGKPIVAPSELESPLGLGGEPFAPFNVVGTPLRASAAFDSWEQERKKPPLKPPTRSRFSHQ